MLLKITHRLSLICRVVFFVTGFAGSFDKALVRSLGACCNSTSATRAYMALLLIAVGLLRAFF